MTLPSERERFKMDKFVTEQYPDVEDFFCISVKVPASIEYVHMLQGLVAQMTNYWNFTGPTDARKEVANRCQAAYDATDWDGCMDCEGVAECIDTNEAVQTAIDSRIDARLPIPAEFPYGQNLPLSRTGQDLSSAYNPTCGLDVLWAQCLGVVMMANDYITDTLEIVETSTNVVELANVMSSTVPLVAEAKQVSGLEGALDMINYFQESVAEGYAAQYTETPGGVRDQIACDLFCLCREDCIITIDRIFEVMETRLSVYFSPPSLTGFVDLLETIAGINVDTTFVVDLAFYVTFGMLKVANFLFASAGNGVIDFVIALKADEPNNDWEILCGCSAVCRLTFDYDNPFTDQDVTLGTLDPGGFVDSEVVGGSGGNSYVQVQFELPITGMVYGRAIVDTEQVYRLALGAAVEIGVIEEIAHDYGDGTFYIQVALDPVFTGDLTSFTILSKPDGNTEPFKVLRFEVVYEC